MDLKKYNRSVAMNCPTCGSTQFSRVPENDYDSEIVKCLVCGREMLKDELKRENSENINEHIREVGKEVRKEIAKELNKKLASIFKKK